MDDHRRKLQEAYSVTDSISIQGKTHIFESNDRVWWERGADDMADVLSKACLLT